MIITNITRDSCSAQTTIGSTNHRKAYENSVDGRADFMAECAGAKNYAEVMVAWGDNPTVNDPVPEAGENTGPPPMEKLREDVDYLLIAEMTREGLL